MKINILSAVVFVTSVSCAHHQRRVYPLKRNDPPSFLNSRPAQSTRPDLFPWQKASQEVRILYAGGNEKPVDPQGHVALCDAFELRYSSQTRVLSFEQCQGAGLFSRNNVVLTSTQALDFENAVEKLQLLPSPQCAPVADAGILDVSIKNQMGELKHYVDSVTCGYGNLYNGVLEYETILNVVQVTRALTGK